MNSDVGRYKNRELEVLGNIAMDYSYFSFFATLLDMQTHLDILVK